MDTRKRKKNGLCRLTKLFNIRHKNTTTDIWGLLGPDYPIDILGSLQPTANKHELCTGHTPFFFFFLHEQKFSMITT